MSDSTSTAAQPSLHPGNVIAHPGSTMAGIAAGFVTLGQALQGGALPTSSVGWFQLIAGLGFSVLAALGK